MNSAENKELGHHEYVKNEYRSSLLCIDSYDNKTLAGRIYNPYLEEGRSFENVMQFLILTQELFNMMDYPQPFVKTRMFWKSPCGEESSPVSDKTAKKLPQNGKKASFILKVIFRQNASWQGSLAWLDLTKTKRKVFAAYWNC